MAVVKETISDFVLDTVGHCFLCLNAIPSQFTPPTKSSTSVHSLHHLSSFLHMDKRKVFKESATIPDYLLAKVLKSRLKSELCPECSKLSDKFAQLHINLERIRLKMGDCLNLIHQKLKKMRELDGTERLCKLTNNGLNLNEGEVREKLQIFDVLRMEAKQKCSRKLGSFLPRIKVQELTQRQISKALITGSKSRRQEGTGDFPEGSDDLVSPYIKRERMCLDIASDGDGNIFQSDSEDCANLDRTDYDSDPETTSPAGSPGISETPEPSIQGGKSGKSNLKIKILNQKPISRKVVSNSQAIPPPLRVTGKFGHPRGQFTFDSKTRKFNCRHCPSTFTAVRNFNSHYKSTHLHLRYQCLQCQKEYPYKQMYERHYLAKHAGIIFECGQCNRSFSHQTALILHQKVFHPKLRISCDLCSKTIPHYHSRNGHIRNSRLGRTKNPGQIQCKTEDMVSGTDERNETDENLQAASSPLM